MFVTVARTCRRGGPCVLQNVGHRALIFRGRPVNAVLFDVGCWLICAGRTQVLRRKTLNVSCASAMFSTTLHVVLASKILHLRLAQRFGPWIRTMPVARSDY